jgi:hypothetical protein
MRAGRLTDEFAWLARCLGWGRSRIRRRTDRIEAATVLSAVAIVLAAVPIALLVGVGVYQQNMAVSAAGHAVLREVPATVVQARPVVVTAPGGAAFLAARAQWPSPHGTRVGQIRVSAGTSAGSVVPIWTHAADGTQADAPTTSGTALGRAAVAVLGTLGALIVVLRALVRTTRWTLDRHRSSAWENEWRDIGPQWTRRAG